MKHLVQIGVAVLLVLPASAAAPDEAQTIIDEARAACSGLEGGEFHAEDDAVQELDLNADGTPDQLVDESRFACSSSASLFAPNGGSMLHAIVNGQRHSWQAQAWRLIDWGVDRVLLLALHGTRCGGYGYQHCYEAIVFNDDSPMTVSGAESSEATD